MKKFITNSSSYVTALLITVIALTFTAGAAMGLDSAVTHKGLGVAVFIIGLVLIAGWMIDVIVKSSVKTFGEMRGEESAKFISNIAYGSMAILSIVLIIVALIVH